MRCKGGKGANSGAALNIISADGDRLGWVIRSFKALIHKLVIQLSSDLDVGFEYFLTQILFGQIFLNYNIFSPNTFRSKYFYLNIF